MGICNFLKNGNITCEDLDFFFEEDGLIYSFTSKIDKKFSIPKEIENDFLNKKFSKGIIFFECSENTPFLRINEILSYFSDYIEDLTFDVNISNDNVLKILLKRG